MPSANAKPHPIISFFSNPHPLAKYLTFEFGTCEGGNVEVFTKAAPSFVRNVENGELHTGYATILLDSILGGAVFGMLETPVPIATVSLSINHLRRPEVGEKLHSTAQCSGVYNSLAYVSGKIESKKSGDVIAIATGTFMIGTTNTSIREKAGKSAGRSRI